MAELHHILACVHDPVLAKKVRYLLASDQCDVEVLENADGIEERIAEGTVSLLILSRDISGHDAIEFLGRMDATLELPATIVLGGGPAITAEFISLVPDPIDTQAIYRIATNALASLETARSYADDAIDGVSPMVSEESRSRKEVDPIDEIQFSDVRGLDEIIRMEPRSNSALREIPRHDDAEGLRRPRRRRPPGLQAVTSAVPNREVARELGRDAGREVSSTQLPAHVPPPSENLSGVLEAHSFALALYKCASARISGAILVKRDSESLAIYVENGSPVAVHSSIPGDHLGRSLVKRSRLTEAQYGDAAKRAIERGLPLGQSLVELAFLSKDDLGLEMGKSAMEQIVGCFSAKGGTFEIDPRRKPPIDDRPFALKIEHILATGIREHCDDATIQRIAGDTTARYFKLRRPISDLRSRFPLSDQECDFLTFSGRAYNIADAAEGSGLSHGDAARLLALLLTTDELTDFKPGIEEFEARIREERTRSRPPEPAAAPAVSSMSTIPAFLPVSDHPQEKTLAHMKIEPRPMETRPPRQDMLQSETLIDVSTTPPKPAALTQRMVHPTSVAPTKTAQPETGSPHMPVPPPGETGLAPRPLVYGKPIPRGPDGIPLETPERSLSREHFQRGVSLLGQGNFVNAEEAFRDAIALCSEEHVYLIGLARAIYYNPSYRAERKLPILKAIVDRAAHLAPDDNRVISLSGWIQEAERAVRLAAGNSGPY